MKRVIILFVIISFILGCNDDTTLIQSCNILQSSEEMDELIAECHANLFDSTSEIEENLIGDWVLSGIIPGWTAYEPTSECLLLSITSESLKLTNLNTGEEFSSTWKIKSYEVNNFSVFYLEPNDEELRWTVGMQFFSKNIMYGAGLADDTDTYVYER